MIPHCHGSCGAGCAGEVSESRGDVHCQAAFSCFRSHSGGRYFVVLVASWLFLNFHCHFPAFPCCNLNECYLIRSLSGTIIFPWSHLILWTACVGRSPAPALSRWCGPGPSRVTRWPGLPCSRWGGEQQCGKHRMTVITMESSRQFEVFNL